MKKVRNSRGKDSMLPDKNNMSKIKRRNEEVKEEDVEEEPVEEESVEDIDEISVEEFMDLPEAITGRVTKVDYEKVTTAILGKPMPVSNVSKLMLEHSENKATVYASEVKRFLDSLPKKGYTVLFRSKDGRRWVLVRKKK